MARTGPADLIPKNLRALRGALEHSVTIQLGRLQEMSDDLVARGTLTRAEADRLVNHIVGSSKGYSQALLSVVDSLISETRKNVEAGVATAVAPMLETAGKIVGTVTGMNPVRRQPKGADGSADKPIALDPIPGYADLTVAQVRPKLAGLSPAELRRVRQIENDGKARKSLLAEIDRLLAK